MYLFFFNILIIYLFLIFIDFINGIVIRAIINQGDGINDILSFIENEFNQYSKNNNYNITLEIHFLPSDNSTISQKDYESSIEFLLEKKQPKYDLYFYDNIFTTRLSPYLLNLNKEIKEEIFNIYKPGIASQICVYNNEWVGLPFNIDFSVLYSNSEYLDRYGIPIPQTWDELIEIVKSIKDKEDISEEFYTYNGLFIDSELGTGSIYEFLYSFRKSIDSPFPKYDSKETSRALEKIKQIKNELDLEFQFRFDNENFQDIFNNGNFIFLKYWYKSNIRKSFPYYISKLPGEHGGISGSIIGGYNIGLSRRIEISRKEASLKVLSFIASKEMQKKIVMNFDIYPNLPGLFEDEEVCSNIDCDFFKSIQLVARPRDKYYEEHSEKFRNYIYSYLYGNERLSDTIQNVININKIYAVTIDTSDTIIGLIAFILIVTLTTIYILSIPFLFIEKFKTKFQFFTKDIWILIIIGQIIIMNCNLMDFGIFSIPKFRIKMALYFYGFSFTFIPVVCRMIINFPKENKYSEWVKNNKYFLMITCILFYDVIICSFFYMPFRPINVYGNDGKNFTYFKFEPMTYFWVGLVLTVKFSLIIAILILGFIEWNIVKTQYDIKFLLVTIYFDLISTVVIFLNLGLEIKDYKYQYFVQTFAYMSLSFINYTFIYGYRIIWIIIDMRKDEKSIEYYIKVLKKREKEFQKSTLSSTISTNEASESKRQSKYRSPLLNLHFSKDISNTFILDTNSSNNFDLTTMENIIPEGNCTVNINPGNNSPGNNSPGNINPGNNSPGNNSPGNNSPGNISPGNISPGNNSPGNISPGNISPRTISPGTISHGSFIPGNISPGNINPGNIRKIKN